MTYEPELVERIVAMVRRMAERQTDRGNCLAITDWLVEADKIAALLPAPVDSDLLEARRLAGECAAMVAGAQSWVPAIIEGDKDDEPRAGVGLALAAIKRGRALAQQPAA